MTSPQPLFRPPEPELPHQIEAEQALIGCILFDNEAYHRIPSLAAEAFYEPLHGRMWSFISGRIDKNLLADPIVLMGPFQDDPAFLELGALRYLVDLVDRAPPAANAYSYAQTIREAHQRRNLIAIAGEMLERARADHETPASDQIVEAEVELYQLAETGSQSTQGFINFDQALQSAMDMAAAAYSRGGQLVGLSTGLIDLDHKLGGLHPSDLLIIAGRPSQGKTALATNIAFHAARDGRAVGFFSLEMSADQLALRIVSDLSGIPGDRIRKGQIDAREFGLMTDASREVSQAPLYIDATGGISIAHLTARARRAKRLHGLSLIVVDYLQLITTKGKREGNRTQEVSEITAALKALAKELNLPIIALSQLSRAVEQREDKRPQLADLRECVTGDTRLICARSGRMVAIRDVRKGMRVLALGPNQKIIKAPVSDCWSTGVKPVFTVTSKSGRHIRATANHPFLTGRGWIPLEGLRQDDCIAVPYRICDHGALAHDRGDLCRLLGYMAGNGSMQEHRTLGLIIPDDEAFADAAAIIARHWPEVEIKIRANGYNDAWISRTFQNGHGRPFGNPMREWLRGLGLLGSRDDTKSVPDFVFEAGLDGAAEFLAGYLETDGCVTNTLDRWSVRFDTTSGRLADDVAALLTKIGVASIISKGAIYGLGTRPVMRVSVAQSPHNLRRFANVVKARGIRGRRLDAMLAALTDRATRNSIFVLPSAIGSYAAANYNFRDQDKALSREKARELLKERFDPVLSAYVDGDLIWDEIRSIEPSGAEEVFDISIPGANCFVANGIVVHNSGSIEQDADCVMFVYREAYYLGRAEPKPGTDKHLTWQNDMDEARGKAELIIGKQRHGPIGTVHLSFNEDTTKFGNLARGDRYESAIRFPYGESAR